MSAEKQVEKEIREAIVFLREHNQTIPSDTIEFMKAASLEKLRHPTEVIRTFCIDHWDRNGKTGTTTIVALTAEQAKIIFERLNPDLSYDEPYY
jgi:hypothetical protein